MGALPVMGGDYLNLKVLCSQLRTSDLNPPLALNMKHCGIIIRPQRRGLFISATRGSPEQLRIRGRPITQTDGAKR